MFNCARAAIFVAAMPCAGLWAQTDARPAFDLADVHSSAKVTNPYMRGGVLRGGRYDVRTASLLELISAAYGVDSIKIQGGPSWLDTERFDIVAKAPAKTPPETVKLMLQSLLADRFQLKIRNENKEMPVFVLTAGKSKPKMKQSDGSGSRGCQGNPGDPQPGKVPYNVVACHNRTMVQLAQDLRDMAGGYLTNPVVDQTGLQGAWDFDLKWTSRGQLVRAGDDGITIFDAVEKQLGLKLETKKASVPVLVIESIHQTPTANAPGVGATLPPPPPAEFELATIRPSQPNATNTRARLEHGRVDAENVPLKAIIQYAWDLSGDELMADLPKFADSVRYDITAKAPPPAPGTETDEEDLRLMLRALLQDRFNLKSHREERTVDGYVLSNPGKPKLQKADPSNRTGCKEGPGADGKDPRIANPILNRLISCQNMTMAQFVEQLPNIANGYAHVSVLDTTGLTDAYDFSVSFSGIGLLRNGLGQSGGSNANGASDPSGAISLPDAINRQLGLKMELKKRPMQVLVIDHLDEKPTAN